MIKKVLMFCLPVLAFAACKSNGGGSGSKLIGSWQAVKLDNPDMEDFFVQSQKYIDTIGKGGDAATNMRLYGVTNMDSMRQVLQKQYDSAKAMQVDAVLQTRFTFRKDSVVILSFSGSMDSSKWYMVKDTLVLTEMKSTPGADKVKMQVLALSDTALKLKFAENNTFSTVTFHPQGK